MKINQFGRSLLPISFFFRMVQMSRCFSSDVYKESTQAKKYQADGLQYGRSMIEMLGVLAIIGVLSVGAIAGYQKAMMKYKLNKQAQQLSHIISVVDRYNKDLKINKEADLTSLIPYLKRLNEIPKDMYSKYNDRIQDVFKSTYSIYHHHSGYTGISLNINDSNYSVELCKNIFLTTKEFSEQISQIFITNKSYDYRYEGNQRCTSSSTCLKDLAIVNLDNVCRVCLPQKECILYIVWYS